MAIVRVSTFLIEEWLFKGLDVEIRDARMNVGSDFLEFSIRGKDVPDCAEAQVLCSVHQEKGCDRWVQVEIKAVPKPSLPDDAATAFAHELGEYAIG